MSEQGGLTQNAAILAHFERGHSLTPLEALDLFGCFRLGARVYDLKALGYDIQSEFIERNGKKFCRYWLPQSKGQLDFFGQQKGLVGGSPTRPLVGDVYDNAHRFSSETTLSQVRSGFKGCS